MKFSISRDALLRPLNAAAGVVERRQTLPILANVMLAVDRGYLAVTGTDLEVEMVGTVALEGGDIEDGVVTVPARKLVDICKTLPEGSAMQFIVADNRLTLRSGRSRFTLSTLPAADFPTVEVGADNQIINVKKGDIKRLLDSTSFAMAQQDVRYYLNGMLWELKSGEVRVVATDGHRLAMAVQQGDWSIDDLQQIILPRKGVMELARLLSDNDGDVKLIVGGAHFRAEMPGMIFTSKLVDGKFPDYERVLPRTPTKVVFADREVLRSALQRASILSNEKYRGICLQLASGVLQIRANNPEQEEAEEEIAVDYQGSDLEIGFNVTYLIDVLNVLRSTSVKLSLSDANSSALVEAADEGGWAKYVVMPMRL